MVPTPLRRVQTARLLPLSRTRIGERRLMSTRLSGGMLVLSAWLMTSCSQPARSQTVAQSPAAGAAAVRWVKTDLAAKACRQESDKSDPNETPYLVCPGIGGYSLTVRRVDAGRRSIDVVDSQRHVSALNYQEVVTRSMFALGPQAEWRVVDRDGRQTPTALVVAVRAHEDRDDPEKVTRTYLAVAKITGTESCVTDRVVEGSRTEAEVHAIADAATGKACARPQPPLRQ